MIFSDRHPVNHPSCAGWIALLAFLSGCWIATDPLLAKQGIAPGSFGTEDAIRPSEGDPVTTDLLPEEAEAMTFTVDTTAKVEDSGRTSNGPGAPDTLTVEQLESRIEAQREVISGDSQLSDEEKKSRLDVVADAQEWVKKIHLYESEKREFENRLQTYPAEIESGSKRLNHLIPSEDPPPASQVNSESLHRQLMKKRQLLDESKVALEGHVLAIRDYQERLTVVPRLRAEANDQLKLTRQAIEKIENEPQQESGPLTLLMLYSKRLALAGQVKMLDAEVDVQELTGKFQPIQHDLMARRIAQLESEIKKWEAELKQVRELETQREAEQARLATATVDPVFRSLAVRNEELVAARKAMHEKLQNLATELSRVQSDIETLQARFGSLKDKIDAAGLTKANGMLLVDLRRNLMPAGASQLRIGQIEEELQTFNLQIVQLTEERGELHDPVAFVKAQIEQEDPPEPLLGLGLKFIDAKRGYLDQLVADNQEYLKLLQNAGVKHQQLIDETHQVRLYIDENALWIRSADPIGLADCSPAVRGAVAFFDPGQWADAVRQVRNRMGNRPYESAVATVGLFLLFVVTRRLKIGLKS
ncbi:MAG: hypothetical protein MK108_12820 [Mariniblastus sp.]|nr:hypothetical protein [Mariniblastus sp.]